MVLWGDIFSVPEILLNLNLRGVSAVVFVAEKKQEFLSSSVFNSLKKFSTVTSASANSPFSSIYLPD